MMSTISYEKCKQIKINNDNYVIDLFNKFNIELRYKNINKKWVVPVVFDKNTKLEYTRENYISRDKRAVFYEAAAFANYLLMRKGIIDEFQKNQYDILLNKLCYCNICLS